MNLILNGSPQTVPDRLSVEGLLATLDLDPGKVAVERNREIILKSRYRQTSLAEGDEIEIVHFIGGG